MRPRCTYVQSTLLDVPVLGPKNGSLQLYFALSYFYHFDSEQSPGSVLSLAWMPYVLSLKREALFMDRRHVNKLDLLFEQDVDLIYCLSKWKMLFLSGSSHTNKSNNHFYVLTQSSMITSLNWGYADCNICEVPAVLFTKNKLIPPKKRNGCTSAASDAKWK